MFGGHRREPGHGAEVAVFRQRRIQKGAERAGVVVANHGVRPGVEFAGGLVGDDVDRTTDGISPVESTLGSAEHLDAGDVIELRVYRRRPLHIDTVDIIGDWRVPARRGVLTAQAAHGDDILAAGHARAEAQGRHPGTQFLEPGDSLGLQRFAAHRTYCDGDLLDVLLAILGGDDDLADRRVAVLFGGRGSVCRETNRGDTGEQFKRALADHSRFLP